MLNTSLLMLFLSVAIGGLLSLNLFVTKSERNAELDRWLTLAMTAIIVYKLFPLLYEPGLVLRPLDLLLQNAGVQGIGLAAMVVLALFFWNHRRQKGALYRHFFALAMILLIAYGLYGLLTLSVYRGIPLFVFKGLVGLLFPFLLWRHSRSDYILLPLAAGGVVFIEALGPGMRWYGLTLVQWGALLVYVILLLLSLLNKEPDKREEQAR
ncbi:MAG: hypothetical protein IMX04_01295 [Candidatus Carbobacillus altaicus]|uniref:Uncharacterized protein n=1 Tax=Candidatus Carbonibacillus altaicus TaxID=2163959 RepID=A0A2R6Y2Y1_9BACL|nr:hypothetical protein [Candidatus Carbobacillus altaicus]PTQ57021.1 MAG: hypothetical protein BSOLF_2291 [Candidatus Carbobacillus altaicus]